MDDQVRPLVYLGRPETHPLRGHRHRNDSDGGSVMKPRDGPEKAYASTSRADYGRLPGDPSLQGVAEFEKELCRTSGLAETRINRLAKGRLSVANGKGSWGHVSPRQNSTPSPRLRRGLKPPQANRKGVIGEEAMRRAKLRNIKSRNRGRSRKKKRSKVGRGSYDSRRSTLAKAAWE